MGNYLLPSKKEFIHFPSLPVELLEHIFSYCDLLSIKCLACCSHAYAEACRFVLWRSVNLPSDLVKRTLSEGYRSKFFYHTTDLLAIDIEFDPTLKYTNPFLDRKQCRNVDKNLDFVFALCNNLNKLRVSYLMRFENLANLMELTVQDHAATDEVLVECCKWLLRLKSLYIKDTRKGVTTHGAQAICGFQKLESLTLDISYDGTLPIYEDALPPKLHELVVKGCYFLNSSSGRCGKLTHLSKLCIEKRRNYLPPIDGFHFIPSAILLKELTILTKINLLQNDYSCSWTKNLVNLEVLRLDCAFYFTDLALETIADNLVQLKKLVLAFGHCNYLTDKGLIHLTKLQHLDLLKFSYFRRDTITMAGFNNFNFMMVSLKGSLGVVEHQRCYGLVSLTWKHDHSGEMYRCNNQSVDLCKNIDPTLAFDLFYARMNAL